VAVDLSDLTDSLQREVQNAPTTDTTIDWLGHLQDAFWEARLVGFFPDYTLTEEYILPSTGSVDLGREWQQLVVLFAAARIVTNEMKALSTSLRAKAGPVEFESGSSALLLRDILSGIRSKIDLLVAKLGSLNVRTTAYIDSLVDRHNSIALGDSYFWE